jgi:ElaB/YqjD/DUF883 family membrane-anchored ribosome-binding protein
LEKETAMQNNEIKASAVSEIQTIREDIAALKADTAILARNIKDEGGRIARGGIDELRAAGGREFYKVEEHVRENPGQSVLLAFAAGLFASYLLGSRR